ncbi:DNA-binding transcriptional regulator Fis [Spongiibacter sp. KMU-158]|uniref:Putative Fis-like DNA-binding protein n=1 Tax=Spongiibacter pelagi TaxID=2760804 RepID=A0A927C372_9GAMM|nr:DNA-binding transcriptional regulator Fis [Spongiibacter pelagi]MBD2858640.1 DNA-binding transcriptional regulator Fis [Spongiibacter pelagi]
MNLSTNEALDNVTSTLSNDISQAKTLRESVSIAITTYLTNIDGQDVTDVYNMVLAEVEAPLLEEVMRYTRNNQTKASQMLGLNRGTLRKKLKQYDLL